MDSELAHGPHVYEVLIKRGAEVLATAVRVQDFNRSAKVLRACPHLKGAVHIKSVPLVREEKGDSVVSGIICEGDKEAAPLARGHRGRSPDVGMYFVTEVGGPLADTDLQNRLAGRACVDAHVAVLFVRLRVEHDSGHQSVLNELVHGCGHNVPHAAVQLHDADNFNSIATFLMRDAVQSAHCLWNTRDNRAGDVISSSLASIDMW